MSKVTKVSEGNIAPSPAKIVSREGILAAFHKKCRDRSFLNS